MLKPQPRKESLAVFGKPWFWRRDSGTMEGARSLARVVLQMRDEIQKLETENRALRGELHHGPAGSGPAGGSVLGHGGQGTGTEEENPNPYVNLRRNVSAPALEGQFKENIVMTVRRYSISSTVLPGAESRREGGAERAVRAEEEERRRSEANWGRLQEEVQRGSEASWGRLQDEERRGHAASLFEEEEEDEENEMEPVTDMHSLKELVQKNRAKVKTVTFLLPVDDIYTNRPVLTRRQETDHHTTTQLDPIAETDS